MLKIGGAILVIVGCSGFGILLSYHTKNETHALKYLISALDFIDCELSFRLTPLSQAFLRASEISVGCIQSFLISAAQEMEHCSQTDAAHCIGTALDNCNNIPPVTRTRIHCLAQSMGIFDLEGQIRCIRKENAENNRILMEIMCNQKERLKCYNTLCCCTGIALVILFL